MEDLANEKRNNLESTDRIISNLKVEIDDLNIVVDEKSQQYNIELQNSYTTISGGWIPFR